MDSWLILQDLLLLLSGAMLLGVVMEHLKQSAILGYLIAGLLLGPNAFDLITDEKAVPVLAELGVSLLLFAIGLEFSMKRLVQLGPIGFVGGSLQVVLTTLLGMGVCLGFGMELKSAVTIGMMVALSSTACVLRVFTDRAMIDMMHARGALGILLLQDIAVVPMVLFVSTMKQGGSAGTVVLHTFEAVGFILILVVGFHLMSRYVLVWLLSAGIIARNRELAILIATIMALGSAYLAHSFNISPALGAFIAGIMLAESPFAIQIRGDVLTIRSLFVTLFFTAIGMMGDLGWIVQNPIPVLAVVVVFLVGKSLIITLVSLICKYPLAQAGAVGLCLAQVGEFSFVIATVAMGGDGETSLLSDYHFRLVVSGTIVTLFVTPYLITYAPRFGRMIETMFGGVKGEGDEAVGSEAKGLRGHVVVIGFGPSGREAAAKLSDRGVPILVVDLQQRNVNQARHLGYHAMVGDATNPEVLEHIPLSTARGVAILLPDHRSVISLIHAIRQHHVDLIVCARSRYSVYASDLLAAGASRVVDEEKSIGRKLGRKIARMIDENKSSETGM